MSQLTITEALAELKTLGKRIEKKREFVAAYLWRQEKFKDPLEKTGGSVTAIKAERQAIADLEERLVLIRRRINDANALTPVTIGETTRSLADWIIWKRDVSAGQVAFLAKMGTAVAHVRKEATQKGLTVLSGAATTPDDVIVNVDEQELAKQMEALQDVLGKLDGQLSLKNALTVIEV